MLEGERRGGRERATGGNLCTWDSSGRRNGKGTGLKGSRTKDKSNVKAWQKGGLLKAAILKGFLKETFEKKAACTSKSAVALCFSRASAREGPTAGRGEQREFVIRNQNRGPAVRGTQVV